ncbi:MAG TPA: rod shape-determining protein MreC [Verrucomicrobiae bacterium]|nr:rod shape-determining protein MreC [Verrucomicrobiae bacterium]
MLKRQHYIALGLIVLMTLTILNLPPRARGRLKSGIGSVFLPLFGLAGAAHQLANEAGPRLTTRSELIHENERLERENQELKLQATRLQELERENAHWKQLWGWQEKAGQRHWKVKLANVVLREPSNWWRTLQIDLGSRNGLSNNLPVLTTDGCLAGRVTSVSLASAQVLLLGDPNCRVSALVENESRVTGVIDPSGPVDSALVDMTYLPPNPNIKPGQSVVTSGNGGIFPKGIPIGKVVDLHTSDYGLSSTARVRLAANLNSLEELWVLMEP